MDLYIKNRLTNMIDLLLKDSNSIICSVFLLFILDDTNEKYRTFISKYLKESDNTTLGRSLINLLNDCDENDDNDCDSNDKHYSFICVIKAILFSNKSYEAKTKFIDNPSSGWIGTTNFLNWCNYQRKAYNYLQMAINQNYNLAYVFMSQMTDDDDIKIKLLKKAVMEYNPIAMEILATYYEGIGADQLALKYYYMCYKILKSWPILIDNYVLNLKDSIMRLS